MVNPISANTSPTPPIALPLPSTIPSLTNTLLIKITTPRNTVNTVKATFATMLIGGSIIETIATEMTQIAM